MPQKLNGGIKMSADNGIYILKTAEGESRVIHAQAIENIFAQDYITQQGDTANPNRFNCLELFDYFHNANTTNSDKEAQKIAKDSIYHIALEYGIRMIYCDLSWKQITNKAKIEINERLNKIHYVKSKFGLSDHGKLEFNRLIRLQNIIDAPAYLNSVQFITSIREVLYEWKTALNAKSMDIYFTIYNNIMYLYPNDPAIFQNKSLLKEYRTRIIKFSRGGIKGVRIRLLDKNKMA